jgi:hypothetical protein
MTVGLDLAKNVFQVHAIDAERCRVANPGAGLLQDLHHVLAAVAEARIDRLPAALARRAADG